MKKLLYTMIIEVIKITSLIFTASIMILSIILDELNINVTFSSLVLAFIWATVTSFVNHKEEIKLLQDE